MGYQPKTNSREFREGWIGRRRRYICRECNSKFQTDTRNPLPEIDRVCPNCKNRTYIYTFVNKQTAKDVQIRASNAELATLRAKKVNPNLVFKIPHIDDEPISVDNWIGDDYFGLVCPHCGKPPLNCRHQIIQHGYMKSTRRRWSNNARHNV